MTTLAELRQANLQEQKKQEESQNGHAPAEEQTPEPQAAALPAAQSKAPEPEQPAPTKEMETASSTPAPTTTSSVRSQPMPHNPLASTARRRPNMAGMKESDKEALADILPAISKAVVSLAAQAAVNEGEPEKSAAFLNRIRGSLNHKVLYPSGVKTTVDMSPALFHRAKKYCLDHGNVTLRQLFLDLLTEFLAEEGY